MRTALHAHPHVGSETGIELAAEVRAVDAVLEAWRSRAAQVVLTAVAGAHLPVVVLGTLGDGPGMTTVSKGIGFVVYLVLAVAAVSWRVDYRVRLRTSFVAIYLALAVVGLTFPQGPYAQVGMVTTPVFALVLLGATAARVTILASMVLIASAPLVHAEPAFIRVFAVQSAAFAPPIGTVWFQTIVKAALLFALMILLDRFHCFLTDALTARVAEHRKLQDEMRERQRLEREIAAIGDRERQRLGQELHDGVCQLMTGALLRCQGLESHLRRGAPLTEADFAPLSSLLSDTLEDTRKIAQGLWPLEPAPDALAAALRVLARRTQDIAGVPCAFVAAGDVSVPDPGMAQHLYRIAQEALSNATRHAQPSRIFVELRGRDRELTLTIEDDGTGVQSGAHSAGMGLRTMAYRARVLGGELSVAPASEGGTRVYCRVPRGAQPRTVRQPGAERWSPII